MSNANPVQGMIYVGWAAVSLATQQRYAKNVRLTIELLVYARVGELPLKEIR
jgi:hypothetical protein